MPRLDYRYTLIKAVVQLKHGIFLRCQVVVEFDKQEDYRRAGGRCAPTLYKTRD
ncbi:hypothetical protein [Shewanella algae]|uniref:hypothetical protein n=1 Tax=Shewanella algae TaxID=38313 RepID=UPI0031F50485